MNEWKNAKSRLRSFTLLTWKVCASLRVEPMLVLRRSEELA